VGRIHIDLGSGDGRGPYRWALAAPNRLIIATDANPDALLETAWKAGRKPARGGVSNLICIAEPLSVVGRELGALADIVTVILPWGLLLQAVAVPLMESLREIAALCLPDARIEIVFSYDPERDAEVFGMDVDLAEHVAKLPTLYREVGLRIEQIGKLSNEQLRGYQTTWAKRLGFGKPRQTWRLLARCLSFQFRSA